MGDHRQRRSGTGRSRYANLPRRCWIAIVAVLASLLAMVPAIGQDLDPSQLGPIARAQIEALIAEKEARTPAQQKIDSRLLLTIDAQRPSPRFPILNSLSRPRPDIDGRLIVDIDLFDGGQIADVLGALRLAGAQVLSSSARFRSIRARVNALDLETIAELPNVRFIDSKREFQTNKDTTSEGDVTHQANLVRSTLGYTGNGQKLCTLSDGVDTLAARQATGDLPALVDVLPGEAGSGDEGTAMLEIMYDLAPGARLGFATANGGEAAFAQNILDLANPAKGGCTIIVDDVSYFIESPFQDGIEAQAVDAVTAAGVLYFSSAANSGNLDSGRSGTWEGTFNDTGAITNPLIPGHTLHEFTPGVTQNVTTTSSTIAFMHWAEPFGAAATDYDLYVLNAAMTSVLASSTTTQNGTQNPFEVVVAAPTFPAGSRLVVAKKTGAGNRMLNVQLNRARLTVATSGATRGHSAAVNAFSVAATPAAAAFGPPPNPTGPYPNPFTAANTVELFSSDGPRRIFFDGAGNLLPGAPAGDFTATGGVVRNKPDITAADGVTVSAPGFTPFFGTSAAAPHAAAVAALLKQAFPAWTLAQVRTGLTASALDIQGAGWDRDTGSGIVMPLATLQANAAPAIAGLNLVTATPTEVNGNGNGVIDSGEDWKLDIVLGNLGGVTGTGIVATLVSNTAGVVVTSAPVSYPNIAVSASAANPGASPFRFSVFNIGCGQVLNFTLSVTTAQNPNPQVFAFNLPSVLVLGAPQTFSYSGPSLAIPDGPGVEVPGATVAASLAVTGVPGPVADVNLRIDGLNACSPNIAANAGIDHTWVGDLVIGLKAPDGTIVDAINRMGDGFTSGPNLCNTTLDDQSAGTAIGAATTAPFIGSFKPDAPLSQFLGKNANGTWQLLATDFFIGFTGHVNRFSIIVTPSACVPVVRNVAMTATKTVSGTFDPDGTVTYTVTITNTGNGVQADNPGDEFVDVLPGPLTLVPGSTTATRGVLSHTGNTVRWNGTLDPGESVVITEVATINSDAAGLVVSSQGTLSFDANHNGVNDSTLPTDDPGVAGTANPTVFTVSGVPSNLDIDGNGSYDALTDGLLIVRYLFGLTGSALTSGAIGPGAQRTTAADVLAYLGSLGLLLDVDGNGVADALTDGLLIMRYQFGLRGAPLISGAVAAGAPRNTAAQIEAYLQSVMP